MNSPSVATQCRAIITVPGSHYQKHGSVQQNAESGKRTKSSSSVRGGAFPMFASMRSLSTSCRNSRAPSFFIFAVSCSLSGSVSCTSLPCHISGPCLLTFGTRDLRAGGQLPSAVKVPHMVHTLLETYLGTDSSIPKHAHGGACLCVRDYRLCKAPRHKEPKAKGDQKEPDACKQESRTALLPIQESFFSQSLLP